jgi:CRP-like cAMP-binding protein
MPSMTEWIEVFRHSPLFEGLNDAERNTLAHDYGLRRFSDGETVFHEGDTGQTLYLIVSGRVRIYVEAEDGQEASVQVYGPGEFFGDLAAIDELPRSASAVALEPTTLAAVGRERLREHLRRSPQLALNFLKVLSERLRYSTEQVRRLSFRDVAGRVARRLLDLAEQHGVSGADGLRISFPLTQTELASLVGASRESVNKALGNLRRQGLIAVDQNHITVRDAVALRAVGE